MSVSISRGIKPFHRSKHIVRGTSGGNFSDAHHGIGFPIGARRLLRASTLVQHI